MESNTDLSIIENYTAPAVIETVKDNYLLKIPTTGAEVLLERDVDFGVIKGLKKPTLYKAGAEKVFMGYGVSSFFEVEKAIEEYVRDADGFVGKPFFFYRVRCSARKIYNADLGAYVQITDGFGSANSMEKGCGSANGFDSANQRLKMARKRAMVDAALMLGQLSSMFAQDIENEDFVGTLEESVKNIQGDNDPVNKDQVKRLYTIVGKNGYTKEDASKMIASKGYSSAKDILVKDYDEVVKMFSKPKGTD